MRHTLLLALPALQEVRSTQFRQIKYSLFPPLSLLTLAGMTDEDGFRIVLRDEHVEDIDVDATVDLVAMTVYVSSAHRAYALADRFRRAGAKVVLGGIHPTTVPHEAAQHADAVCIGPAERVWPRILRDFQRGVLRRCYRGECRGSAALVPPARRDLMNPSAYLVRNTMVTTRGCPNACSFCYKSSFWGRRYYEHRPLAEIETELASLAGRFVFFLDDNLLADRPWARRLFAMLRGSGWVWQAAGSLEVARHRGFLDAAYEAGCRSLFVGFESLSPRNMRQMGKSVNAATDYAEAIRRFHEAGIMINGSFVFGFDHDTPDVFERTVEFATKNRIETATFHVLTPYPGTRLFDALARAGRLLHRDWSRYDTRHAVFRPARMSAAQLEAGTRRAYRDFYAFSAICRRAAGTCGMLKRIAYATCWRKVDRLWSAILGAGLLPAVRPIFERIVAARTREEAQRAEVAARSVPACATHPPSLTGPAIWPPHLCGAPHKCGG
jgi:radical SAM superfamily enzyme YgiQ (UPF0313 family)